MLNNSRTRIAGGTGLAGSHSADPLVKGNAAEIVALDISVRLRREDLFIEHA